MPPLSPLTEFALLARRPDETLDLEALAIGVARIGRPEVRAADVAAQLDALAAQVADDIDPNAPPDRLAVAMSTALGGKLRLRGDASAYANADGSFIDRVIATRGGLPIALSVLWVSLGRRLGVPVAGVNFPGHFLACIDAPGARVYVDPFQGGQGVEARSLMLRLSPSHDARAALSPAETRPIVARMLLNLKNLWIDQQRYDDALAAVERILLIAGELPVEVRDRGLLCIHVGRAAEGIRDLERYIALRPDAADRPAIAELLAKHR